MPECDFNKVAKQFRARKIILLFLIMRVMQKNLHTGGHKKSFFINSIEFFKHLKTTLTVLFFVEKQRALSFII